jgi:hypothetical protein
MRLPRFRCSLGTFLFAVAVVAVNCAYLMNIDVMSSHGTDVYVLGVLPLVNVVAIGTLRFLARRIRSLRVGVEANPRSSVSGVTYFSLHFLVLGCLAWVFAPESISSYMTLLGPVAGFVEGVLKSVFGEQDDSLKWLIIEYIWIWIFISGPPLLLSWIGHLLAKRCVATLPPRRCRATACLVSLSFASTGLAICVMPQPFAEIQDVDLDFLIVDEDSGQPIDGAFLRMPNAFYPEWGPIPPRALTDARGHARLTGSFFVSGERNAFQTMGDFSTRGRWIEVSTEGHRTLRVSLTEMIGPFADSARPRLRKVALVRGETREDSFRDLAGQYLSGVRSQHGGPCLAIEPDGRFGWSSGGRNQEEEYGYLKWHDGEIELIPIPQPGKEVNPYVKIRYRPIQWGNRLYLCPMSDYGIREFCRSVLSQNSPTSWSHNYGLYFPESDLDKPLTGTPLLPLKLWARFLLDEMSLKNDKGGLRLALAFLVLKLPQNE